MRIDFNNHSFAVGALVGGFVINVAVGVHHVITIGFDDGVTLAVLMASISVLMLFHIVRLGAQHELLMERIRLERDEAKAKAEMAKGLLFRFERSTETEFTVGVERIDASGLKH